MINERWADDKYDLQRVTIFRFTFLSKLYPKASEGLISPDKTNRKWAMDWYGVRLKNEFERKDRTFSDVCPPKASSSVQIWFIQSIFIQASQNTCKIQSKGRGRGIARVTRTESTISERSQPHTKGHPPSESPKQSHPVRARGLSRECVLRVPSVS